MEKPLLSAKSDLIFKLIFSKNIDILTDFLMSVLDLPVEEYSRIEVIDPHLHPDSVNGKLGILDVKLHTSSGKIINIEIQVSDATPMKERIIFYTSRMISEQIGKGEEYGIIKKVISIVITDYILITENDFYHNRYNLYDKNTGSTFTDILEINTLELPKLPQKSDDSQLWNWLYFLNNNKEEELTMLAEKNKQIEKAVLVLKELSQDERTRLLAEEREKARRDELMRYNSAINKSRQEGKQEGRQEGRLEAARENALKALSMGADVKFVADITGLSIDEVKKLAEQRD